MVLIYLCAPRLSRTPAHNSMSGGESGVGLAGAAVESGRLGRIAAVVRVIIGRTVGGTQVHIRRRTEELDRVIGVVWMHIGVSASFGWTG